MEIDPVLLRAASDYLMAITFDRPRPIAGPDDTAWLAAFREASGIHGLGPFLGLRIERGELDLPAPLDSWLRQQTQNNRIRQQRMHAELLTALEVLADAGFHPMPLKGAALLLAQPDGIPWRAMSDLDLLVSYENVRALDLALAHAGYCLHSTSWKHRRYTTCAPGPPLIFNDGEHPDNPRDLEIHASLVEMFRGFRWDLTPLLLADAAASPLPDVSVPSDGAMSVHLAVHTTSGLLENSSRAIHLIDLARALDLAGIDPLIRAARAAGIETHARFLYPALAVAARETGNAHCQAAAALLAPFVTPAMRNWSATVSLYTVSWAGRHDRALLDRVAIWTSTPLDRARMLSHTVLAMPDRIDAPNVVRDGLLEIPRRYLRHYRHLLRRII